MRGTWFWSMLYTTFWLSIIYHKTLQAVDKSGIMQRVQTESKYLRWAPLYCVFLVSKRQAFAPWEQAVWWALCKGCLQACFKFLPVIMQEPSSSYPRGSGLPGDQEKNTRLSVRFGGWFLKVSEWNWLFIGSNCPLYGWRLSADSSVWFGAAGGQKTFPQIGLLWLPY